MIEELKISNFKSIFNQTIGLSNVNVFIGENGCGKSNILESVAMLSAAKDHNLNINGLSNKGVRVTKPSLTMSSFLGQKQKEEIELSAKFTLKEDIINCIIYPLDKNDIYSEWINKKDVLYENVVNFAINKEIESEKINKIIEKQIDDIL